MLRVYINVLLLLLLPLVSAQGFFEQFFGGGHQQQPQPGPAERWRAHGASIDCSGYLCPITFDCVQRPVDCPCPNVQDTRCLLNGGDDYVCTRGDDDCSRIKKMQKAL